MPNKICKVLTNPASLLSILKTVYQWANETIRQMKPAQSFAAMNAHHDPSLNTNTTHSNSQEREEIPPRLEEVNLEDISIYFLCTYSTDPNWKQRVSTCNDYGQTLAHIAVTLGYSRLLHHLFRWQIDLNAVDSMGLSALHYAYLFKQEECAKLLIHAGADRFILDDLRRSPADLNPSLEVRLRSIMDSDRDSSAGGAPPIEYDTEMPDEAGKLYAKHFLVQQWMGESEDSRRGEVSLSRCQSHEPSSPPVLGSTDERNWGVPCDGSPSLVVRTPEAQSAPVVAEEIDWKALIKAATPTHIIHPPSPISEVSPQTQKANSPSGIGQYPFSHPAPLGGASTIPNLGYTQLNCRTVDFYDLSRRKLSVALTTGQEHLLVSGASEDIGEQNDAKDVELLQRSSSSPMSTSVTRQRNNSSEQVEGPTLDELRTLAQWPRLRDQVLPSPTVGGIELDPSGVADRYGVKGMSVLTAFVNIENFSCRVCSFKAKGLAPALLHQRQARHFQT